MTPSASATVISISISLIILIAVAGCNTQQDDIDEDASVDEVASLDEERTHPSEEAIPRPDEVDFVLDRYEETASAELDSIAQLFGSLTRVASYGQRDGASEDILGRIQDISVDGSGRLYVLDSHFNEVVILDQEGTYKGSFGEPGQGPEEFSHPDRLALGPQGGLIVAERSQLKFFEANGNTFSLRNTTPHQTIFTRALCTIDEYLYARGVDLGQEDSGSIQVYASDGEHSATFGHTYPIDDTTLKMSLSDGTFACHADNQQIVSGFNYLPIINSYSIDGTLEWQTKIANYTPSNVIRLGGGSTRFGSEDPTDHTRYITFASSDYIIVQVAHRTPESRREEKPFATLRSYILCSDTGEGAYIGTSLPPLYQTTDELLVAATSYPYPRIDVYRNPLGSD